MAMELMDIIKAPGIQFSFKLIVISINRSLCFVKIRRVRYTKGDNEKECRDEINTIACKGNEL